MANLTQKQKAFAIHYAACLNATESARLAGYSDSSDAVLGAIGHENLRKPKIRQEIDRLLTERTIQAEEVLARLSAQAEGDLSDFFDIQYGIPILNLEKAKERGKMHLVKKISFGNKGFVSSIELESSQAALVHLGKAYGLFSDRIEIRDWRDKAVEAIQRGELDFEPLSERFGHSLAVELFQRAGVDAT